MGNTPLERALSGPHWFTLAEALEHWSRPDHEDPVIAARYMRALHARPGRAAVRNYVDY